MTSTMEPLRTGRAEGLAGTQLSTNKKKSPPWRRRESFTGWLWIAPAVLLFLVFGAYPLGYGFALSFAQWNGFSPNWTWVGIDNYLDLLSGSSYAARQLTQSAGVTVAMSIFVPLLTVAISFPIALMLNSIGRFRGFLRTLYFLPYVTAGVAVLYAWRYVFDVDGAWNTILRSVGLGVFAVEDGILGSPETSLVGVIVVMVWTTVPLGILLYLTGLQTLDGSILEAASVDGAGPIRTFFSISFPLLAPTTALLGILALRGTLQDFVTPLILTNGGPFGSTTSLSLLGYDFAFGVHPNFGYASALGWLLFVIGVLLALLSLRAGRRRD